MNLGIGAMLGLLLLGSVSAGTEQGSPNHGGGQFLPRNEPDAFGTRARVAYLYSRDRGTDLSKNVKAFTNPSTGIYCITPSVSLNYAQTYPLVTVEWANSSGTTLFAYWEDGAFDCPTFALEVRTFDGSGNRSSAVAFDFLIE